MLPAPAPSTQPTELVESYRFWDVVTLWAAERAEHESLVALALVNGVVRDGLRVQSREPRWVARGEALRGEPYVGYTADPHAPPVILREGALKHMLRVVGNGATVARERLGEEFLYRADFRDWLVRTGQALPAFWFGRGAHGADGT